MHDQLFKEVLQAFFADFVRLVLPDVAAQLRLERPRFRDKERFTDTTEGEHRYLDVLAEVETVDGEEELVLVHVEIEAEARGSEAMGHRMWRYAMQLWLRDDKEVLPIVLYLQGGDPDVYRVTVERRAKGRLISTFTHWALGLSRSRAIEYLDRPEALAAALAALMDPGELSVAEKKLECLRRVGRAEVDDARRFLLANIVETYIELDEASQEEYESLLAAEPNEEVRAMEMTWAEKMEAKGMEKGIEKGMEKGIQKGIEKGLEKGIEKGIELGRLEGMRTLVADLLELRFGSLSETSKEHLGAIESADELFSLHQRAFDAASLGELGL